MNTRQVMDIAMRAGEILLTSGAEIYRVEDTIIRICNSYNVDCESFVLPTGIFITGKGKEKESLTLLKRIRVRTVDLQRVELVNSFSRSLKEKPLKYEEALKSLEEIENNPGFTFLSKLAAAGLTAFVFTLLFQGTLLEAASAFVISLLIYAVREGSSYIGFFQVFGYFISGLAAGGLSLLTIKFNAGINIYKVIIGSVIILLPGVAITSAIKDALYGDINSSLLRLSEGTFIVVAVGAGVAISLSLGLRWV